MRYIRRHHREGLCTPRTPYPPPASERWIQDQADIEDVLRLPPAATCPWKGARCGCSGQAAWARTGQCIAGRKGSGPKPRVLPCETVFVSVKPVYQIVTAMSRGTCGLCDAESPLLGHRQPDGERASLADLVTYRPETLRDPGRSSFPRAPGDNQTHAQGIGAIRTAEARADALALGSPADRSTSLGPVVEYGSQSHRRCSGDALSDA
jgi:hypothetical protein